MECEDMYSEQLHHQEDIPIDDAAQLQQDNNHNANNIIFQSTISFTTTATSTTVDIQEEVEVETQQQAQRSSTHVSENNNKANVEEVGGETKTLLEENAERDDCDDDDDDLPALEDVVIITIAQNNKNDEKKNPVAVVTFNDKVENFDDDDDDGPPPLDDSNVEVLFPRSKIDLVKVEIEQDVKNILHYQFHKDDEKIEVNLIPLRRSLIPVSTASPEDNNSHIRDNNVASIVDEVNQERQQKEKQTENENYESELDRFRRIEFSKIEKSFSTDEALQRIMVAERARMERQCLEKDFEKELIQLRDNLIAAIRSKLRQQSTFTTYFVSNSQEDSCTNQKKVNVAEIRRVAQQELSTLDELVHGMKVFAVEPRQVDLQLFKARNVLLVSFQNDLIAMMKANHEQHHDEKNNNPSGINVVLSSSSSRAGVVDLQFLTTTTDAELQRENEFKSTHLPPPPPPPSLALRFAADEQMRINKNNGAAAGVQELTLRERIKLVVDIKDLCDKMKRMKMNALASPSRWEQIEELYERSLQLANQVPVAATLTLLGTKAELERFIRAHGMNPEKLLF